MKVYVGIDLGTVNTCVATCKDGKIEIIDINSEKITPSVVYYYKENDEYCVGKTAVQEQILSEGNCIYDTKRFLGLRFEDKNIKLINKDYPFEIAESEDKFIEFRVKYKDTKKSVTPQQVSSNILKYIKSYIDTEYTDYDEVAAVITVPANFNDFQRKATKKAAEDAGLNVLRLMKEPVAAANYYFHDNSTIEGLTLVFDLGGGTFDVSILERVKDEITVKCFGGDNFLGGIDFDRAIVNHWKQNYTQNNQTITPEQERRLRISAKEIKEELSNTEFATHQLMKFWTDSDETVELTRAKFEELIDDLLQKCLQVTKRCLSNNNIEKTALKNVTLVGGSCLIPKVQQIVKDFFGPNINFKLTNPDITVAAGAALQADLESYEMNIVYNKDHFEQFQITGAEPFNSLNLEVPFNIEHYHKLHKLKIYDVSSMHIGHTSLFDVYKLIVEKNTKLPIKRTFKVKTAHNNQKFLKLKFYEGEWKCSTQNHYLGHILFNRLPEGKAGSITLTCTVEIDLDNTLNISAKISQQEKSKKLEIYLSEIEEEISQKNKGEIWTEEMDANFEILAYLKTLLYEKYQLLRLTAEDNKRRLAALKKIQTKQELIEEIEEFMTKNRNKNLNNLQKLISMAQEPDYAIREEINKCKFYSVQ